MSRLDSKDNHYTSSSLVQQAPKPVRWLLDEIMADLDNLLGELGQEMRAIADYWQIDLGIVVTLNFAYELREVCVCVYASIQWNPSNPDTLGPKISGVS